MGGFVGCVGAPRASAVLGWMLRAPTVVGGEERRARAASIAVFGRRDVDLAEDAGDVVAVAGAARDGGAPIGAGEILRRWRARGPRAIEALSGEFSVAASVGGETVVARDRLGTRPLYVGEIDGGGLAFATSLAPLVFAGVSPRIDHDALVTSLALGYPAVPRTALAAARQLRPGEMWTLSPARRERRYFHPRERLGRGRTLEAAAEHVGSVVTRAVACAVPAGARVAAFLSGGLDSSVVLARLCHAGVPVRAFTLHFGDEHPGEIGYARAVAAHLGVPHHVLVIDDRRFTDALDVAVLHLEDVVSEAIAVPNFLLAREAARDADVVFTGEGGDQSFGGPKNIGMALARAYAGHPASAPLATTYLAVHQYLANDLERALSPECLAAFDPRRLAGDVVEPFFDAGPLPRGQSFVGRLMIGNTVIKGGSNILVKVAKMVAFANDVALRSPLFDPDVVRAAFTVPPWQKQEGTAEKLVLRTIARRWLPPFCVDRPKRGMSLPMEAFLRGALGELARDTLTERAVKARGLFRWEYVEPLLRLTPLGSDAARSRAAAKLWLLLVTELHHQTLDRLARDARALRRAPYREGPALEEAIHA